jgi:Na+-translocating ferredoxin:NAD+ oxidoreductase RnfD subunit
VGSADVYPRDALRLIGTWLTVLSPKWLIAILVTTILVLGEWQYQILGGYERLAVTLSVCVATEYLLSIFIRGRPASLQSAYISGVSLALLTKPQSNILWPFAIGAFVAISSKYVLRFRGRHLWNPTNFAISALVLLAPAQVAVLSHQWGNDPATNAVIWVVGLLVVTRARVLHVTFSYLGAFLALAWIRSLIVGTPFLAEIAPVTGPMYQLFIFFMVTDPRTTVATRRGRILVAVLVAVVEFGIRLAGNYHIDVLTPLYYSPPILALAMVGPTAMWWDLRRRPAR